MGSWRLTARFQGGKGIEARQCVAGLDSLHGAPEWVVRETVDGYVRHVRNVAVCQGCLQVPRRADPRERTHALQATELHGAELLKALRVPGDATTSPGCWARSFRGWCFP